MRWRYLPSVRRRARERAANKIAVVCRQMRAIEGDFCPLEGPERKPWWDRSVFTYKAIHAAHACCPLAKV